MAGAGSERRRIFAREVFAGAGRAAAALAAGYHGTEGSLRVTANKLMRHPDVKAELELLEGQARTKAVATREEALELLTRQLRFSPKALLTTGGAIDLAAAVQNGVIEMLEGVEVSDTEVGQRIRVKFPDRQAAVDRLAKLLGWNKPEQHEIKHTNDLRAMLATMTDEELGVTEPSAGEGQRVAAADSQQGPEAGDLVKTGSIPAGAKAVKRPASKAGKRRTARRENPKEPPTVPPELPTGGIQAALKRAAEAPPLTIAGAKKTADAMKAKL
jgi:phage terminase small subunit